MMYRWPKAPYTSFSTLRLDGSDYIYGSSSGSMVEAPIDVDARTNRSKWQIGDIEVTQILQIVFNNQTGQEDVAKIAYTLRNTGSVPRTAGMRVMIDDEINYNDGAVFRVPGIGLIRNETEFTGSSVPDVFQEFFNVNDNQHVAASTLKSGGATAPDRLVLAEWPRIHDTNYDYTIDPTASIEGDSAYAMYWNPASLAPGDSRTYVTFYGLAQLETDLRPPLALGVTGPATLSVVNGQYSPNPFDVVATVFNNGSATATGVQLTLNLPAGLSLATGAATQSVGDLAVGQERQVSWSVQAAPQGTQTALTYAVTAVGSNTDPKTVQRQITVPVMTTGTALRIDTASSSSYTDTAGNVWQADTGFIGGTAVDRGQIPIANTDDDRIYQTERWGMSGYKIPLANGSYAVKLHFAETNPNFTRAGIRVFNVNVEGQSLNNLDVFAQAGGQYKALVKSFNVQVTDGELTISFTKVVQQPEINGIEIIPGTLPPPPPSVKADFSASPRSGPAPLTVKFTDASQGNPTGWAWDFDNNGTTDSTDQNPSYTYNTPGKYTVKLTVSGPGGSNTRKQSNYIAVAPTPPPTPVEAGFTASPRSGTAPLSVQFTDTSKGNPTNWAWDFDNNGTTDSTDQNPSYTYNVPGKYTVKLTVSGPGGSNTKKQSDYITVSAPTPNTYSIAGRVATSTGTAISGVTIQATGPTNKSATTDNQGNYTIKGLSSGAYTLTPSKNGYTFAPASQSVNVPPSASSVNFTGATTPPTPLEPQPFLDLPFDYGGSVSEFSKALQDADDGGRVNDWFDHKYPDYGKDNGTGLWLYNGRYTDEKLKRWVGTDNPKVLCYGKYCYDGHSGIDFTYSDPIPGGKADDLPIRAAADGKVVSINTGCTVGNYQCGRYYGNYVIVKHDNGYFTRYAHLASVSVITDTTVKSGDVLGIMGNTGNSTGPHLHFAVYRDDGNGQWDCQKVNVTESSCDDKLVDPFGWRMTENNQPVPDPWVTDRQGPVSYWLWKNNTASVQSVTGSQGKTLTEPTNAVVMKIPPNAFVGQATLQLSPEPVAGASAQLRQPGRSFWLRVLQWLPGQGSTENTTVETSVEDFVFTQPVTITVSYTDADVLHLNTAQMRLYQWDEASSTWQPLPSTVNTTNRTVTATTTKPGSFSLQAPLVCPADTSEPDDNLYAANALPADGTSALRIFDGSTDEDWMLVETLAGGKYAVQTSALAAGVDTVLQVYGLDGVTLLASDDNGGGGKASRVEWVASASAAYLVRVSAASGSASGCGATYSISATQKLYMYLPMIRR